MKRKYVVIEDTEQFDCYSVLSKSEYKSKGLKDKILFEGSIEKCNEWIEGNPHPDSHDFGIYFGNDEDNTDEFFI